MSEVEHPVLPVALVFGDAEASAHLREALDAIGARIVCDAPVAELASARIVDSGAGVVLVNLDDGVGENLDLVYDTLDESRYRVVFNDPDISHGLSGWEHARWLRHLAAKLRDDGDFDPPRPAGVPAATEPAGTSAVDDAWMSEALDVLGDAPSSAAPTADVARVVVDTDVADLELGDIDLELPAGESIDETSVEEFAEPPPEPQPSTEPQPQAPAEAVSELDDAPVFDEAEALLAAALDDGDASPPAIDPSAATSADELDLGDLEAEINAAFGSDALAALDEASAARDEDATASLTQPDHDEPGDMLADIDVDAVDEVPSVESPAPQDVAPAVPVEPLDLDLLAEDAAVPPAPASAPAPSAPSFNIDHLSLVELEPDLPEQREWEAVEHRLDPDARKPAAADEADAEEATTADAVPASSSDAAPAGADAGEFGIELMTAEDYLAPDAPTAEHGRAVIAPELMSLSDAVAPEIMGEPVIAPDSASGPLPRLIVLGASIGGPDAVREFLSVLPARFPATFVLVQHLGSEFVDLMINQLGKSSALPVRIPGNGERAVVGEVLVVPHGRRLSVPRNGEVELAQAPEGAGNDPSINLTMTMAAEAFGADAMAIIFSGMAGDAVAGALEVAAQGGTVWAQEPSSCVVSTMVDGVIAAGIARFVGTPRALAERLIETLASEAGA